MKTDGLLFKVFTGNRLVDGLHAGEGGAPRKQSKLEPWLLFWRPLPPVSPLPLRALRGRPGGELCGAAARVLGKEGFMDETCQGRKREMRLNFGWHERECVFFGLNNMGQDTEADGEVTVPGNKGDPTLGFRC